MNTETRRDGTVQLADWWEDLLWPKVMASAALGLRPARVGLAFFGMVVVACVGWLGYTIDGWIGKTGDLPLPWEVGHMLGQDGPQTAVYRLLVTYPIGCMTSHPFTTCLLLVAALPAWLVVVGAVSRMAAMEFSRGEFISWAEAVGFSLRRLASLLGAVLGPLIAVWLIALTLAVAGWLLLSWPGLNIIGGALYIFAIVLGVVASLIGIVFVVGKGMLIPAVVCDGADAIDAIQRAYAYTLDRPVRLFVYMILAAVGFFFVSVIVVAIVGSGLGVAYAGANLWLGEKASAMLSHGTFSALFFLGFPGQEPEGTYKVGSWLIRLWTMIPVYGVLACLVSCCIACSTVIYLAMRRICDGQDTSELWIPGEIEGAVKLSLAGRAEAAASPRADS